MTRKLRVFAVLVLLLALASLMSLYSYGRFAERARGAPGQALPADRIETPIDRVIAPLVVARPGQSGLSLFSDNLDAFAVRAATARSAGRSLDLQYYLWHQDLTGELLLYELLRAADRGVRVRLLLDDLNAHRQDHLLAALDLHRNVEVRMFNPSRGRQNSLMRGMEMLLRGFSLNRRMHNKAWIADGRVAVVGGRNIGDEYFGAASNTQFLDADLAVIGPPVAQTATIFDAYWNSASAIPLAALAETRPDALAGLRRVGEADYRSPQARPYLQRLHQSPNVQALWQGHREVHWTGEAQVHSDPPEKAVGVVRRPWLVDVLMPAMMGAQREMQLISPYFVPGDAGVDALVGLRRRGVAVSVLTNSLAATDVAAVHGGYAPYRRPLLEGGVELYELMPRGRSESRLLGSSDASLHTKAMMVDGEVGFVGSFNLDPRSINLNTEMGILFRDRALTAELLRSYAQKTGPRSSYWVQLVDGRLTWEDGSEDPPHHWTREPDASLGRRVLARVVGWLPLESQL
ncbi:phospholipase D family protein [Lysobacter cavernae]|uniref:Phospholipase D family protein n=1 Tax=Lysobacter cavernae TaxID=1685901 RepID=A0ABV7RP93_9GAMM